MRFVTAGGLGDNVAVTALVREYKRYHPDKDIVPASPLQKELFRNNPHVSTSSSDREMFVLNPMLNENMGNIALSYAKQVGIPMVDTTPEIYLSEDELNTARSILGGTIRRVAIDPWSTWPSRRWPIDRYRELAEALRSADLTVIQVGAKAGVHHSEDPERQEDWKIPCDLNLWNAQPLRIQAAVIALCDLFVGNDSGLFHVAAAVGTPQVVFFSTKPWYCRSYWNTVPLHAMRLCPWQCKISCRSGKHCLSEITTGMALEAVWVALKREYKKGYR